MGSVSATAGFVDMAQIGANGKVINSTKQGGLVAVDYFGAMWGCFIGGWAGDKLGGKKGVWISSLFCMLGAALMCGSQNANMFICARIIAGIGLGFINVIVPLSVSKLPRFTTGARATRSFLLPIVSLLIPLFTQLRLLTMSSYRYCHCLLAQLWRAKHRLRIRRESPIGRHGTSCRRHALTVAFLPKSPWWLTPTAEGKMLLKTWPKSVVILPTLTPFWSRRLNS